MENYGGDIKIFFPHEAIYKHLSMENVKILFYFLVQDLSLLKNPLEFRKCNVVELNV